MPAVVSICLFASAEAVEILLARASAAFPDENAATIARMPTFSITIAIRSSSRPKPTLSRARVYTGAIGIAL